MTPAAAFFDRALSRLFRYDLSRSDVVKWVAFARQALAVLLGAVVTIAVLSALFSVRQAEELLRESLSNQGRAVAAAASGAAYVPLSLRDEEALDALIAAQRAVPHLGALRVRDASGRVVRELVLKGDPRRELSLSAPIVAPPEAGAPSGETPIGSVEATMRTDWIDAKAGEIALENAAVSGGLALVVLGAGLFLIRALIERTRELAVEARLAEEVRRVNAELEAFSYSVAHDLRAPLRAIDGFSRAVLESDGARLSAEGRDFLGRVLAASSRMSRLISDLLELSRVTRAELRRERVDLSAAAREILDRLRRSQPERRVEALVADGLSAHGDPTLARVVLENLLGNAWKYTSKRPQARIEFGRERGGAFFVRDDGAGFDMAFAGQLFKPFSRLHSVAEFEGTGIGLASAQRAVHKHGGRIWAEGEVGKGATFRFTL